MQSVQLQCLGASGKLSSGWDSVLPSSTYALWVVETQKHFIENKTHRDTEMETVQRNTEFTYDVAGLEKGESIYFSDQEYKRYFLTDISVHSVVL